MANSPLLYGPNNTATNIQNRILNGNGSLLAFNGAKNYIGYNNFENNLTTGWSLGTVGTRTNGLPTGSPTFGSGASGNLTLSTTASSPLAGTYSLSLASSAATTAGDMLATASLAIDIADQAKVLSWSFNYQASVNPSNGNWSGTSSNTFAVAVWDVTNSVWLTSAGNFNLVQSTGVGVCTGTCQTGTTTANIRFVIYCANASANSITMLYDSFYLGPQVSPQAPVVSDWVAYTPTFTGMGSVASSTFYSRRVGDSLEVNGKVTIGTSTGVPALISIGYNGANANVTIDTSKVFAGGIVGFASVSTSATTTMGWDILAPASNLTTVIATIQTSTISASTASTNASTVFSGAGQTMIMSFVVPIVGWSSNAVSSSDTDTRVVAMQVNQATPTATITASASLLKFTSTPAADTHGSFSTSTGQYTCPVTGYYRCSVSCIVAATFANTNFAAVGVGKNSSTVYTFASEQVAGAAEGTINPSATGTILCNAGDTLAPLINSSGTSPTVSSSAPFNYFYVERLSGPAVITATESVNARYFASSTTPGTSASPLAITYTTKDYDSHNAYASGTYTIPVSGKYQISAALIQTATTTAASEAVVIQIFKNGTQTSGSEVWFSSTTTKPITSAVTDQISCNSGDTITVKAGNDGSTPAVTASNFANYFTIARIGN